MQVNYNQVPQNTNQANAMSDHHAQIYPEAGMVCQNLQGPYAIKKNFQGYWTFDCPNESKVIQKTTCINKFTKCLERKQRDL